MQFFYLKTLWIIPVIMLVAAIVAVTNQNEQEMTVVNASCYEKVVALTFDDGPGYKTTMRLLDGLKERNVRATFFTVGVNIEKRKEVLVRMKEDGHLIGNHTYSHVNLDEINEEVALEEIIKTNQLIKEITGEAPKFIRPPYGLWSVQLEEKIDMTPVLWTIDTSDWCNYNVNEVVEYVVSEVENGDIILMHDIYETSVVAALEIVDRLQSNGYVFVTVDELFIE